MQVQAFCLDDVLCYKQRFGIQVNEALNNYLLQQNESADDIAFVKNSLITFNKILNKNSDEAFQSIHDAFKTKEQLSCSLRILKKNLISHMHLYNQSKKEAANFSSLIGPTKCQNLLGSFHKTINTAATEMAKQSGLGLDAILLSCTVTASYVKSGMILKAIHIPFKGREKIAFSGENFEAVYAKCTDQTSLLMQQNNNNHLAVSAVLLKEFIQFLDDHVEKNMFLQSNQCENIEHYLFAMEIFTHHVYRQFVAQELTDSKELENIVELEIKITKRLTACIPSQLTSQQDTYDRLNRHFSRLDNIIGKICYQKGDYSSAESYLLKQQSNDKNGNYKYTSWGYLAQLYLTQGCINKAARMIRTLAERATNSDIFENHAAGKFGCHRNDDLFAMTSAAYNLANYFYQQKNWLKFSECSEFFYAFEQAIESEKYLEDSGTGIKIYQQQCTALKKQGSELLQANDKSMHAIIESIQAIPQLEAIITNIESSNGKIMLYFKEKINFSDCQKRINKLNLEHGCISYKNNIIILGFTQLSYSDYKKLLDIIQGSAQSAIHRKAKQLLSQESDAKSEKKPEEALQTPYATDVAASTASHTSCTVAEPKFPKLKIKTRKCLPDCAPTTTAAAIIDTCPSKPPKIKEWKVDGLLVRYDSSDSNCPVKKFGHGRYGFIPPKVLENIDKKYGYNDAENCEKILAKGEIAPENGAGIKPHVASNMLFFKVKYNNRRLYATSSVTEENPKASVEKKSPSLLYVFDKFVPKAH